MADQSRTCATLNREKLVVMFFIASGSRRRAPVSARFTPSALLERLSGRIALGLVADVEEDLLGGERDDGSL